MHSSSAALLLLLVIHHHRGDQIGEEHSLDGFCSHEREEVSTRTRH
jgi:hypothetical protein